MIQKQVLQILENNSKASIEEIAGKLDIKAEQVETTIKQAEKQGIILKYKTLIDWAKLGEERIMALIEVKAIPHGERGFKDIAQMINSYPQVRSVYLASGAYDLVVLVVGSSMHEVAVFVSEKLATLNTIQGTVTHFLLKTYKEDGELFA